MRLEDAYVGMKCITDYSSLGRHRVDTFCNEHGWHNEHIVVVKSVGVNYIECDCLTCGAKSYTHSAEYLRPLTCDDDCESVDELVGILI